MKDSQFISILTLLQKAGIIYIAAVVVMKIFRFL
jgi:hypothetical protein